MPEGTTIHLQRCLDRLLAGDSAARDELVARAAERLTKLARKMFRGEGRLVRLEETGDVAQGALLRLWKSLRDARPASLREFFRLAATQIRREMIDLARHHFGPQGAGANHLSVAGAPGDGAVEPVDLSHDPGRLAQWAEFHEHAGRLPDAGREVFDLVFYQGLSHAEAAALLDVSTKTVQRRWQEACASLHAALGGRLPGL